MYSDKFINQLLTKVDFGAGNFLQALLENNPDIERDSLILDNTVTPPGGNATKSLSLKQIAQWSDSLSAWYEEQGVSSKDPVSLYLEDDIHYFIHYLSLTKIGAIPVLINGSLDPSIVKIFLQRIASTLLVCSQKKERTLQPSLLDRCGNKDNASQLKFIIADKIALKPTAVPRYIHKHQPNDPVLLGHTSGTTGIPKGVQFNHKGFIYGVKKQLRKQVGERIMSALPHSHAAAISIMMSSLLRGSLVKIQQCKDADELLADIAFFKPDLFVSFPKVYVDLCRFDLDKYNLSSIGYWLSTGDANHEPHIKKLLQQGSHSYKGKLHKGSVFIDNLGSSEFGFAAFRNLHSLNSDHYKRRIGKPFDWVAASILSEEGEELGPNEIGLLGVQSETVTTGYWNNSLLTEKNRLGGFWLTGDLAYKDENDVYYHVDRTTDSIRTKEGLLYSCQTEEFILRNFSEIFDCSIIGVNTENNLKVAVVEVELNEPIDTIELLGRINSLLIQSDVPQIFRIITASSTKNTGITGKKLKRVMRDSLDLASTELES
jgi:acyl-coenzyme A synthetase/AMP-(fatty) acid ligase